jgi:hypothetical protein
MGKSLKYVSDFQFPSECGFTGSTGKTMVKGYARGGKADIAQDKAMVKTAVHKHEKSMHKGEPLTKMAMGGYAEGGAKKAAAKDAAPARKQYPTNRSEPMIKAMAGGMIKDKSKLGIEGNKNPGETKMHTAPDLAKPKTMMKSGGSVKKMAVGGGMAQQAAANFARDESKMSGSAAQAIGRQAMARGQQINQSGPQLPMQGAPQARTQNGLRQQAEMQAAQQAKPMPSRGGAPERASASPMSSFKQRLMQATAQKSAPRMAQQAAANFARDESKMSNSAAQAIGRQAMARGQQINQSGPQLPMPTGAPKTMMKRGGMTPKQEAKVGKVMGEYKAGELHSGSKSGPVVKSRKQAVAIAMSEAGKKKK